MVQSDIADCLTHLVSDAEIRKAVFDGKASSSPGPDGYNFHFYKKCWHIIGPKVCKAVKSFFISGIMPTGIKATALALIPKTKHASSFNDFRPIALCNVIYKIISKIIANRLKLVMPHIVKDNQSGFIKSRISTDHIILAQEILSYAAKGKKSIFCAKFDIRKAFDTISREFILARLLQKGFHPLFISWIKSCIFDVKFSIVIKGSLEGYFSSLAGLRQGCPLIPYLFCIAMDAFSSILDDNLFVGAHFKDFRISHLLYADDLLVFGEASPRNCNNLLKIINIFTKASGLHINLDKSSLLLPKHLNIATDICRSLSLSYKESITYLGVPIFFRKLNISDISPLIDGIIGKLSGWNAKLLSFVGRLQYLKFTMLNSIAYWIRGATIPKAALNFSEEWHPNFYFLEICLLGKNCI
ncbi:integrator complex subunit 11 [Dendrobium catenatum]|uniref:Integrator complex subunit 11 n=1 Tax=Dendrobium catenatum TaxID=906689 RepID=A0A2I0XA12_9ASPA|nr:integrator complex subunit 11 [Dendrobium catenatum]